MEKLIFKKGAIVKGNVEATTEFFPSEFVPPEIPISTPLTFPLLREKFVLTRDKNNWWNPLGGHQEEGENWFDALKREAYEEAGVDIEQIRVYGFIKVTTIKGRRLSKYPSISAIPITTSVVIKYHRQWKPLETLARGIFDLEQAKNLLKIRGDNGQMLEIFNYIFAE